ncbi:MAG: ribosomal RNA small subunit methyltransferase A [Clostridia bacterium]|nr:ribosomal RNA small subunit methyltransferase A [Clostridia bacterium]
MKQRKSTQHRPSQGFRQKHALGQHFLEDTELLNELLDATGVGIQDDILEIGPGGGDMTRLLCSRCRSVTAVEIDRDLIPILRVMLEGAANFKLVEGDILKTDIAALMADKESFHVVANIPYYLTTELMERLLQGDLLLKSVNVMVQKEAAQRIVAVPSTPEYGPLAIRAQYYTEPQIVREVKAECFTPPPKVDSAFVYMPWRTVPAVSVRDEKAFFKIVRTAFGLRRKTLCNNLIATYKLDRSQVEEWLSRAGLPLNIRGEALTLQQFADLANNIKTEPI